MNSDIRARIEKVAGVNIKSVSYLSSGNNAQLHRLELSDGERLVAKIPTSFDNNLEIEAYMLRYLRQHTKLPGPQVIIGAKDLLVMEFVPNDNNLDDGVQEHAAELLAELHKIKSEKFGLERDTLIGSLHQPNKQTAKWPEFFAEQRLRHMAAKALSEGKISENLMHKLDKLAAKLDRYIDDSVQPSLIHGDMWQGNILTHKGRVSGFIDPAIYYADPEIELAFSTLFGTFGESFFKKYNEINPIRQGFFEVRKDLYNLYPLLVHVRLFGGGYVAQMERIVSRLIN